VPQWAVEAIREWQCGKSPNLTQEEEAHYRKEWVEFYGVIAKYVSQDKKLLQRDYDWESLYDLSQDIERAIDPANNTFCRITECDEGGVFKGTIRVTLEFIPEDN
jgi:hypothetical protein